MVIVRRIVVRRIVGKIGGMVVVMVQTLRMTALCHHVVNRMHIRE